MHKENDTAHSHLRNEGERMEMGAFPSQHVLITQTVAHSIAYVYKEYVVYIICIVYYYMYCCIYTTIWSWRIADTLVACIAETAR